MRNPRHHAHYLQLATPLVLALVLMVTISLLQKVPNILLQPALLLGQGKALLVVPTLEVLLRMA